MVVLLLAAVTVTTAKNEELDEKQIEGLRSVMKFTPGRARGYGENLLRFYGRNPDFVAAIGHVFLQNGRIDDAEYFYKVGCRQERIATSVINLGGDIELAKNNRDGAVRYYERAIYFDKRDPEGYMRYAKLFVKDDPDRAVAKLRQLQPYRQDELVRRKTAEVFYTANKFRETIDTYAAMPTDSLLRDDLVMLAMSQYFLQDYSGCLTTALRADSLYENETVFKRLVMYTNTELEHYDEAIAAADRFFGQTERSKLQYLDYIYYGYALNGKDRYKEAIASFNKALLLNDGERRDVVLKLSEAYQNIGDYAGAIDYYRRYMDMLQENERTPYVWFELGRLYYDQGTDEHIDSTLTQNKAIALTEADHIFEKITTTNPDSYLGYYWRARTNHALDAATEKGLAKPYYQKVIEILSSSGDNASALTESYKYLAYYYYKKSDKQSARKYVDKILYVAPTDQFAQQMAGALY